MKPDFFGRAVYKTIESGSWTLVGIGSTTEEDGLHIAVLEGYDSDQERMYHTMSADKTNDLVLARHNVRYYRDECQQAGMPPVAVVLQDAIRITSLPPNSLHDLRLTHTDNHQRFSTEYHTSDSGNGCERWTEQDMRSKADHVSGFLGITITAHSLEIGGLGLTEPITLWPSMAALN